MVILVVCLCVINLLLWTIFLIRFKKLFSTDKIIEKTTEKMNKLVYEIDRATERDTFLAGESTKRIQAKIDEAERKMELFNQATQRLRDMIAEADKINRLSNQNSPIYGNTNLNSQTMKKKSSINPNSTYEVTASQQGELFEEDKTSIINVKNETTITPDGAAYREVPLIHTKMLDDYPVINDFSTTVRKVSVKENKRKQLIKSVQELYNEGLDVNQIANHLSCSVTEVQLIIDMNI